MGVGAVTGHEVRLLDSVRLFCTDPDPSRRLAPVLEWPVLLAARLGNETSIGGSDSCMSRASRLGEAHQPGQGYAKDALEVLVRHPPTTARTRVQAFDEHDIPGRDLRIRPAQSQPQLGAHLTFNGQDRS